MKGVRRAILRTPVVTRIAFLLQSEDGRSLLWSAVVPCVQVASRVPGNHELHV